MMRAAGRARCRRRPMSGADDDGEASPLLASCARASPRRPDAGRRLHARLPRRSRARLLAQAETHRRGGRLHHRAGDQPGVRRADRPVVRGRLAGHGQSRPAAPRRAGAGPRHPDARCPARRARGAGVPGRGQRASDRDQRAAARQRQALHPRRSSSSSAKAGIHAAVPKSVAGESRGSPPPRDDVHAERVVVRRLARGARPGAGGAGDRHRQRVPGRPADPAAVFAGRRLARARGRCRCARGALAVGGRAEARAAGRPAAAAGGPSSSCAPARTSCSPARRRASLPSSRSSSTTARPRPATGDTLQAVRRHAWVDPLSRPGLADLTAHVQFAPLARKARAAGLAADGPMTQAEFLGRLGVAERAARLMAANPEVGRRTSRPACSA